MLKQTSAPGAKSASEAAAQIVGPWLLESMLSDGGPTQVFRARPVGAKSNGSVHRYAIKLLRPEWHTDRLAISRMRDEAQVGTCVVHRHVVSVLFAHVHRPPFYVTMPLLGGRNVAVLLKNQVRLPAPSALWIARQAAEGLHALHTLGYIHGDVKPANLMVSPTGHVTLIDLSCARRVEDEPTLEPPPFLGTPHYLAPEIFAGRQADRRSDLYGLGITLFEMLTGRLPIGSHELKTIADFKRDGKMPSVRLFAPQVRTEIADFVRQLTARDLLRRPPSAYDAAQSLMRMEILTLAEQIPA